MTADRDVRFTDCPIIGSLHSYFNVNLIINRQKNILKECVFVDSVLKIQCHVVKNTLLQTVFFGNFAHWDSVTVDN